MLNYSLYQLSTGERLMALVIPGSLFFCIGWVFYNHVAISLVLALNALFYPQIRCKELIRKRKEQLQIQFKNALYSLSSSLGAGRSVENSFREAVNDLKMLYPDPQTYITKEFQVINLKVENGESIEMAIDDFSKRAQLEDIRNFADVFITCKRTGGSIVEVIRRTSHIIGEKLEIKQEIHVMVAQKRFESKILGVIPFFIVALLSFGSADYMEPLYHNVGMFVMTISLILLALCHWMTKWIMDLKV